MGIGKRIGTAVLAVLLATASLSAAVAAKEETPRVLKVAVYNDSNLANQDDSGNWVGSDIECLANIAQRTGLKMEFIDSTNDPDFLANLDNGIYDIVCDVVKTPQRESGYLFNDVPLGTMNNILAVRSGDDRWTYGDIAQVSKMKVGLIAGYANNSEFRSWCAQRGVAPEITEYPDIGQLIKALSAGEADAILYSMMLGLEYTESFRTVLELLPESYYFVFRKTDIDLKNTIDTALSQIISEDPDYFANLNSRYREQFGDSALPLSVAEQQYIQANPKLRIAVLEDDEPYFSWSGSQPAGIIPDYYALITKYSGLSFEYHSYATQGDAVAAIRRGQADILGIFSSGILSASANGLAITEKIVTVNCILLTKSDTDVSLIKTVAAKQRATDAFLRSKSGILSDVGFLSCENAAACFAALNSGRADAAIAGMPSATWLLNQTNSSNYSITALPGMSLDLCSAVRLNDRTLCSILSKSIAATRENINGIITRDTLPEKNWKTYLNRVPAYTIVLIAAMLAALVIGLVWALALLKRRQKERAAVYAAAAETEKQRLQVEVLRRNAEEQNRFFSNISHDMRTPLNAVLGFIRLAGRRDISSQERDSYLEKAEVSGTLMLDLINDTLTMSKAASGKLELHLEPIDTEDTAQAITTSIRVLADQKHITFSLDKSGYRPRTILADQLALQKVFLNILNNAIKYTPPEGHVWVTIYDDPREAAEPDTVFVIRDDGIGIAPEFLPHIFEPFQQEKRAGYEAVGTGLGLSIVKQLVTLMGGTVAVASIKGQGTTFTVRIHFQEAAVSQTVVKGDEPVGLTDLAGRRILLCEDNQLNRKIAAALLREREVSCDQAENGERGVAMFRASDVDFYDAVLMDIRMPVLDGYAAARQIRELRRPDAQAVPIIALTADAFPEDVQKCQAAGMNAHLAKPINPELLYQVLAEQISRRIS